MAASLNYPIYPIAGAVARIYRGGDPWVPLGNFLHDWWCYAVDYRQDLIAESPPSASTLKQKRWAAFCAATVEELCYRTSFPCPDWTNEQTYFLEAAWFYHPQLSQREWLLSTTPETFKRHNVFVGGSVLDNKYELRKVFGLDPTYKHKIWTPQELLGVE